MQLTETAELYKQALAIEDEDLSVTEEQNAARDIAQKAWYQAREQRDTAYRSRKDKAERIAVAESLYRAAGDALEAAKKPLEAAEHARNIRVERVMEQLHARIAVEAFDAPIRYVNSVPTGETVPDYYGTGTRPVYRTTVDSDPVPLYVRGYEAGDIRIVPRNGRSIELRYEVQGLSDETYEDSNARKDRFGYSIDTGLDYHKDLSISWGSLSGGRTIDEAMTFINLIEVAIRIARVIERIRGEVEAVKVDKVA